LSLLAGRNVEVQVESGLLSVKKRWDFQTNSTSLAILAASDGQCGQCNRESALKHWRGRSVAESGLRARHVFRYWQHFRHS